MRLVSKARRAGASRLARLLLVVLLLGVGAPAGAQPSSADKQAAKAAFARAEAAEKRHDWRTAIDEYQQAYDFVPHPDVLFNIAVDLERLEDYRDAATYYRRYLDESDGSAGDRAKVETLIGKLRDRPGLVTITSTPTGAQVRVDGKRAGVAPHEVKLSGDHVVEVEGLDGAWIKRQIQVEYGEAQAQAFHLTERSGTLIVSSNVAGASVSVDGAVVGTTPFKGVVPAGTRQVVVSSTGWAVTERTAEVPADGAAQITVNLVRPAGFVPPVEPAPAVRYYIAIDGGGDVSGEAGALYEVLFGVHRGPFDFALGYGFSGQSAALALQTRAQLSSSGIRPYLRASALFGASSMLAAHVGVLVGLPKKDGQRYRTWLYADAGAGITRPPDGGERALVIPIVGGVQFSY